MATTRLLAALAAAALVCFASSDATAQNSGGVVPRSSAARVGLDRAWYTQVQLDRSRGSVTDITHAGDLLLVLTSDAVVQAIEADSGRTRWITPVGREIHPSLAPAANDKYVAVVNGSTLYILQRATGRLLWDRRLGDAPGAGPALTQERAFVPMISGRIEAYELEDPSAPPWAYYSDGRALVQPLSTQQSICWPTDRGFLYVAQTGNPQIRFRVETQDEITSSPAYKKPYLYAASLDGYVYAVEELSGTHQWRFSAGNPISEPPAVVGDRLYVCPDRGGMFCLDTETSDVVWWTPRASRFVSASAKHVYALDRARTLLVLDAQTGAEQGKLPVGEQAVTLVNVTTDRIYLCTRDGLLQCLHDSEQPEPLVHAETEKEAAPAAPEIQQGPIAAPQQAEEPADAAPGNPFGNPPAEDEGDGADNPFGGFGGGGDAAPEDGGADNPFGGDPFGGGDDNPFN